MADLEHTYGITQFASSGFRNPLLLFDGLYVGDLDPQGNATMGSGIEKSW